MHLNRSKKNIIQPVFEQLRTMESLSIIKRIKDIGTNVTFLEGVNIVHLALFQIILRI